jgi:hypothetical protein
LGVFFFFLRAKNTKDTEQVWHVAQSIARTLAVECICIAPCFLCVSRNGDNAVWRTSAVRCENQKKGCFSFLFVAMQRSLAVVICLLLLQHVGYIAAAATCSEDGMCSGGDEASKTFVPSSLFFFRSGSPHHLTIRNRAKSSDSGTQGIWYVGQCASKVLLLNCFGNSAHENLLNRNA